MDNIHHSRGEESKAYPSKWHTDLILAIRLYFIEFQLLRGQN